MTARRNTIGANDAVTVNNLAPGQHTVVLSGVAENCSVQDGSPETVTVSPGATADASFNIVHCYHGKRRGERHNDWRSAGSGWLRTVDQFDGA